MQDRTMIKLGLLFMAITIVMGVNRTISAYNHMMGTPQAPRAFVVNHGPADILEIGVLGQRLSVPDPLEAARARMPAWRGQVTEWPGQAAEGAAAVWRQRTPVMQEQVSAWRSRLTAVRTRAAELFDKALMWTKEWLHYSRE